MLRYSKPWLRFKKNRYKRANEIKYKRTTCSLSLHKYGKKPCYLGLYVLLRYREGILIPYGVEIKKSEPDCIKF